MSKPEALEIIMLLSAVESWSFSVGHKFPDFLYERLANAIEVLRQEVLK